MLIYEITNIATKQKKTLIQIFAGYDLRLFCYSFLIFIYLFFAKCFYFVYFLF